MIPKISVIMPVYYADEIILNLAFRLPLGKFHNKGDLLLWKAKTYLFYQNQNKI